MTTGFGSAFAPSMVCSWTQAGVFSAPVVDATAPLSLHPATHALHYGSACFEGLKAHRGHDGVVRLFRAGDHARRLRASAQALCLPVPTERLVSDMIRAAVTANLETVPDPPGALYLRPTLLGVDANIGAAVSPSAEALLYVIASPVGDYVRTDRAATIALETRLPRSTAQFGRVKAGANYAMALGVTMHARAEDGADQVLFAPGGDVQETGAANFMLVDDERVVTRPLDGTLLHGVTRDSVLTIAGHLGYRVEERALGVDEVLDWARHGEAALVGTAVVMAGVGTIVHDGARVTVGDGGVGPNTKRLRDALVAVQRGEDDDHLGWTDVVS